MKVPRAVLDAVKRYDRIVIASHENPDGDALGSSIGFALALRSLGKSVTVFNRDGVPDAYRFLPGCRTVTAALPVRRQGDALLILLDCNSPDRAGIADMTWAYTMVIDHHETESSFGDVRWIERKAAATGMMIHALSKAMKLPLTKAIAANLYTAIALDTGTFRYRSTSAGVLRVGAELVEAGAQPHVIADALYENWSMRRFRLFQEALKTIRIEGPVATMFLTKDAFRRAGADASDTENFSNFARKIRDVDVSVLFREGEPGFWRASLRSKGDADVAKIAERFGGGGHRNAAGYRTSGTQEQARSTLLTAYRGMRPKKKQRSR